MDVNRFGSDHAAIAVKHAHIKGQAIVARLVVSHIANEFVVEFGRRRARYAQAFALAIGNVDVETFGHGTGINGLFAIEHLGEARIDFAIGIFCPLVIACTSTDSGDNRHTQQDFFNITVSLRIKNNFILLHIVKQQQINVKALRNLFAIIGK